LRSQLRLILLVLVFALSLVLVPVQALAARSRVTLAVRPLRLDAFTTANLFRRAHDAQAARPSQAARARMLGLRAVQFARHLLGVPYVYGGSSPSSGFDCSGFVRFVYAHFGVDLPHSSYADFDLGRRVARRSLRPGDLVFFDGLGHVGMYVGDGRFIHAPHTGTRVEIDSLTGWYAGRFDGARRVA